MNAYEVSSGLAMPYAALALMGNGGAVAILLMMFMAVTSAMSSETVATTALVTYNIYQAYIKPDATGQQLLYFSHYITIGFAIFCSSIAVAFNHGGFSVGFLITAIGIFVDSAIVPIRFCRRNYCMVHPYLYHVRRYYYRYAEWQPPSGGRKHSRLGFPSSSDSADHIHKPREL